MNNKLIVPVKDGQLIATTSTDTNYPGIDIEFIPEKENINHMSNPRVLVEQATDDTNTNYIRAIVWNNPSQEDYSHNIKLYKQQPEFFIREDLCNNTTIGIEDINHKLYKYHTDNDEVTSINGPKENTGKLLTDSIAKSIQTFALQTMLKQPHRWESPVDYQYRCADCTSLIEKKDTWFCNKCHKPCKKITICPKGLVNPILTPNVLLKQNHLTPTIHQNTSDINRLSEICNAGKILCDFCENDNCEKCQVTNLLNDAYCEFGEDNED